MLINRVRLISDIKSVNSFNSFTACSHFSLRWHMRITVNSAMVRWSNTDCAIENERKHDKASRHCYYAIGSSLLLHRVIAILYHRVIALSLHHAIPLSSSHCPSRAIASSLSRYRIIAIATSIHPNRIIAQSTQTWCDNRLHGRIRFNI